MHVEQPHRDPLAWVSGRLLIARFSNSVLHHYPVHPQAAVALGLRNAFNVSLYAYYLAL